MDAACIRTCIAATRIVQGSLRGREVDRNITHEQMGQCCTLLVCSAASSSCSASTLRKSLRAELAC